MDMGISARFLRFQYADKNLQEMKMIVTCGSRLSVNVYLVEVRDGFFESERLVTPLLTF